MPRYFIDLHDGTNFVKDKISFDAPDMNAVRARVLSVVTRYADNLNAEEDRQDLFVIVRGEDGLIVLRSHLALDFEELERV